MKIRNGNRHRLTTALSIGAALLATLMALLVACGGGSDSGTAAPTGVVRGTVTTSSGNTLQVGTVAVNTTHAAITMGDNTDLPVVLPGMVVTARSDPVGRPPLVALIETVRFGVVPVQALQNRSRSTRVSWPVTPA